jgi:hypothetical protein
MHGWDPKVIDAVGGRQPNPQGVLAVFYSQLSSTVSLVEPHGRRAVPSSGYPPERRSGASLRVGRPGLPGTTPCASGGYRDTFAADVEAFLSKDDAKWQGASTGAGPLETRGEARACQSSKSIRTAVANPSVVITPTSLPACK